MMRISLMVLSKKHPIGGNIAMFELANEMAALGVHVNLLHCGFNAPAEIETLDDISWFSFAPAVDHYFLGTLGDPSAELPDADVISADWPGRPDHTGKPFQFIQGKGVFGREIEAAWYLNDYLKICVSRWLVDEGIELGVQADKIVHLPLGLRHEKYQCARPIEGRTKKVAFCFNRHQLKRTSVALDVLARVKKQVPELEVVAFGVDSHAVAVESGVPPWMEYHQEPDQKILVQEIYNAASVFLCTSRWEGFGMPSLEAMACGAALVTTDNGGSREFARDGQTALVCPPGDVEGLTQSVTELLDNRHLRTEIARRGMEMAARFSWEASARTLVSVLQRYQRQG